MPPMCATIFVVGAAFPAVLIGQIDRGREDSKSHDAVRSVIAEFDRVNLVGLGEDHSAREDSDFRLKIIRDPEFARKVNDIVIEFGNPLYQSVLDRFVDGDDVPEAQLRKVWSITTQGQNSWQSPVYEQLIVAVRNVNSGLPADRRIRVLAGDYPVDSKYFEHLKPVDRDAAAANVITKEVLDKHQKALVIFGARHFLRSDPIRMVSLLKADPRASWFVIVPAVGPGLPAAIASHTATHANPVLLPATGAVGRVYAGFLMLDYHHAWDQSPDRMTLRQIADACLYFGSTPPEFVRPPLIVRH